MSPIVGTLEVTLVSAEFKKDVDRVRVGRVGLGKQDPYAVLTVGSFALRSKTITDGGKRPKWDQSFSFGTVSSAQRLRIEFFDKNVLLRDVPLGSAELALERVVAAGPHCMLELPLGLLPAEDPPGGGSPAGGEALGSARLEFTFQASASAVSPVG